MGFLTRAVRGTSEAKGAAPPPGGIAGAMLDWPYSGSPPDWWLRAATGANIDTAVGVPALLGIFRLLTGAAAMCETIVYDDASRERLRDTWQWSLLHDAPSPDMSPQEWRADVVLSLLAQGEFMCRKYKTSRGRVGALVPVDVRTVDVAFEGGEKVFYMRASNGKRIRYTRREMLHGRVAASPSNPGRGIAPITSIRSSIETAMSRIDMERTVMDNDARPGMIYKSGSYLTQDQADEWARRWMSKHSGAGNRNRPTIISSDDDITVVPLNLADLQFVEQTAMSREALAAAYNVPTVYVGDGRSPTYEDRDALSTFALGPNLRVIDGALGRDIDLFPQSRAKVETITAALLRMNATERAAMYASGRQTGWLSINDIRRKENEPPVDGGDVYQLTPVGAGQDRTGSSSATGGK